MILVSNTCLNLQQEQDDSNDNSVGKRSKAMSPGSMNMPTMNNWDMNQALSPYLPPDMNTIASGSMISTYNQSSQNRNANSNNHNYDFGMNNGSGNNEFAGNGPLSHLNESVNSLDPLNAMEKSLNDQVSKVRIIKIVKKVNFIPNSVLASLP